MFRRMVREGIEAVANGDDPRGISRDAAPLPIYARETVKRTPSAATPEADAEQLRRYSEQIRDRALTGA